MDLSRDSVEKLIATVESHPLIYNKNWKEYSDKYLKEKAWREVPVCEMVVDNWHYLTQEQRTAKGKEIQTKWQNLRTCFRRELNAQKQTKSGQAAVKRSKYVYFDQLLFLLPSVQNRETASNYSPVHDNEEADAGTGTGDDSFTADPGASVARPSCSRPKKRAVSYEDSLLQILQDKLKEELDEDKSFLLSLLSVFKPLDADQKMDLRIEMMQLVRNFQRRIAAASATSSTLPRAMPMPMVNNYLPPLFQNQMQAQSYSQSQQNYLPVDYATAGPSGHELAPRSQTSFSTASDQSEIYDV